MTENSGDSGKKISKDTIILISGIVWLVLGILGMTIDPGKLLITISQLVLGVFILVYYFWIRLK